ncbi:maleylacetoacetate isomerase [Xinfangfangia sp. CPCC 101601]|uniref:Maleylacetoacetate isomerase n=1 Tax=Pseudogemmobacter lacusdianii TaxID=3069608 RepID=A0ABU0VXK7_9RHOB|nr:maleylacetoacetate isomerase [Xinfangfangia sp. CPCC 101601]MDQ2066492.1 maleylacetoacetate isomerase [Xinfangfangia sp. CPCC 101601]
MTRLYDYWRSSAAYRVRIALNLLGIGYEAVPVNLVTGEQRGAENLARNPQGLVPTLEIDGVSLTQSLAIMEYLHETHGALLPEGAVAKARVRALAYAVAMEIAPICNLSVRNHVAELTEGRFSADDWQRHYIGAGLTALERMLQGPQTGRFCHGDQVSIADICLIPQVYNAQRVGLDVASWPTIAGIMARLQEIPAVQAAHPDQVKP